MKNSIMATPKQLGQYEHRPWYTPWAYLLPALMHRTAEKEGVLRISYPGSSRVRSRHSFQDLITGPDLSPPLGPSMPLKAAEMVLATHTDP